MTVPTSAELAARLTLARAIAADYAREARGEGQDVRPDWYSWAARLHTALVGVLAALEALASDCDAQAPGRCDDHAADYDLTARYKALVRALGGDR